MLTERHKLVALAHVSNVTGGVLDARRAAALAPHRVGAKLLLDGCQSAPHLGVNVSAPRLRFLRVQRAQALWAYGHRCAVGNGRNCSMPCRRGRAAARMIDRVTFERTTYAPRAARFEGRNARDYRSHRHSAAAADYVDAIGLDPYPRA